MPRRVFSRSLLIGIAAAVILLPPIRAQQAARFDAAYLRTAYDRYRSMTESSPYRAIPWQYLGPTNVSGRATDIAVADRGSSRRIYAAYATSGVWKTDDNGATWQPVFEHQASTSIGDIAVAPSDPDIVWVGTGEANLFRASMAGVGVYKSIDGGRTFSHSGLTDTQTIARILVHPSDPDTVYVAATGHAWTDNETRGVFKTTDGGRTWTRVFYRSPRTGANDLVMDPSDPDTLYASMWQRIRRKWSDPRVESGYDEGGIWKTTDGGKTWTEASDGLPAARFRGRIGIDVARSNPNVLYAFVDNYDEGRPPQENERDAYGRPIVESRIKGAEIYRTDDKGRTWRKVSESNEFMTRHSNTYGWVFGQLRVDPANENTIYTMGIGLHASRDAGKTFQTLRGMHGDHHGLWIDPKNPAVLYNANDGGFYSSEDSGKTWKFAVSAGGAQFYNVTLDNSNPAWAYGSIQDHNSRRGQVVLAKGRDRIPAVEWSNAPGGEGSHHAVDPVNPNLVYSHRFYGGFTREDLSQSMAGRGERGARGGDGQGGRGRGARPGVTAIRPPTSEGDPELRAQWMAPIVISPHDTQTIYAGYQFVFRSTNRGDAWERISPDLTGNDPSQMLLKSSSAIPYQTITALAESPRTRGLLYAGTDDGRLHVTVDGGKNWTDLTANLPTRRWHSRIVPSRHEAAVVYVTQRGREDDDFGVYVYKSTDHGKTFTSLAANLPAGPVNVIREDPANPGILYLGTDFGAFVSTDGGKEWKVLGGNLPSTQVSDLEYHARDHVIVISTYGRGMYAMDALELKKVR
ncbi:MAG TPA: hypothetical protein VLD67_05090 [Vicinamibacterales bacterium]|nr:hypothetical protein [Vicinamibacterales bacterium]